MTNSHECPGAGCRAKVEQGKLCCRDHWYELPKEMRDRIWHTYRAKPFDSEVHMRAVMDAIRYLRAEPEQVDA